MQSRHVGVTGGVSISRMLLLVSCHEYKMDHSIYTGPIVSRKAH